MENKKELYSDYWEIYQGEYWKREYDIQLKDGTVVENCYPNGGEFNSISDLHDQQSFNEGNILKIRFSHKPRFGINEEVSSIPQYIYLDKKLDLLDKKITLMEKESVQNSEDTYQDNIKLKIKAFWKNGKLRYK